MLRSIAALSALGLAAGAAMGDITLASAIQLVGGSPSASSRVAPCVTCRLFVQSIGINPTGTDPFHIARSIRHVNATIRIHDPGFLGGGINVVKSLLTAQETYGAGLPNAWLSPPVNDDIASPWQGLMWPYRDLNDYPHPNVVDLPLPADEVGSISYDVGLDKWLIEGIEAGARGGPTEPFAFYDQTPGYLNRGITGNGFPNDPASYFAFDVLVSAGTPLRNITIEVINAQAIVVVENTSNGTWFEQTVDIPDFSMPLQVPRARRIGFAVHAHDAGRAGKRQSPAGV